VGLNAPIRAGARLTGKINKDWRIGVMDIQTGQSSSDNLPGQNFGIVTLQRRVFSRSNIGFMFVNKDGTGSAPNPGSTATAYNRNVGAEFNLASSNNTLTGKLLGLKSFTPGVQGHDYVEAANLQYLSKYWTFSMQQQYVSENYRAEVGYVPRTGYNKLNPLIQHNFFPKSGSILSHGLQASGIYYFDENFHSTDNETILSYLITFRNRGTLTVSGLDDYVMLLKPFDPTNTGKENLAEGFKSHWNTIDIQYASKPQSVFTYLVEAARGGYYDNGTKTTLVGQVGYRFQPYVNLVLNASFNDLHLPAPYGHNKFWLIGPRADVTFTNTLYFTTYVQYNEQAKNMNINSRLQWRYKPASDFFIVYGDNSIPSPFTVKNRQLTIKWTYWWNI
jgi:hypothetical protein